VVKKYIRDFNQIIKLLKTMEKEEKQKLLQGMFSGADLREVQVIGIAESGSKIVYKEVHASGSAKPELTDEQIARAIMTINGKGKSLDSKQKWAAVHWVLRWVCNFPVKSAEFCARVAQLPLAQDLEFPCDNRNIRELSTLSFCNQDPRAMDEVKPSRSEQKEFVQLREVALALLKELQM
jgi:hypothetical protein